MTSMSKMFNATSFNERVSQFLQAAMAVPFGVLALSIAVRVLPQIM